MSLEELCIYQLEEFGKKLTTAEGVNTQARLRNPRLEVSESRARDPAEPAANPRRSASWFGGGLPDFRRLCGWAAKRGPPAQAEIVDLLVCMLMRAAASPRRRLKLFETRGAVAIRPCRQSARALCDASIDAAIL